MSSKLMDTEPGGETPQYESIKTVDKPHDKQGGQLGHPETSTATSAPRSDAEAAERGAKTTENIRYGQNVSESGVGGMTVGDGTAQAGGFGRVDDADKAGDVNPAEERRTAGYGGAQDMNKTVGA